MKIKDIQRPDKKDSILTIRTTKDKMKWMKKMNVSPTKLFTKALEELIFLNPEKLKKEVIIK